MQAQLRSMRPSALRNKVSTRVQPVRPCVATRFQNDNKAGQQTIDKLIIEDHDKVRFLLSQYKKASSAEEKQNLGYQMIRELSMHASKEEEVVYPQIKKAFGDEEYQHLLGEHMELKKALAKLGEMHADKDGAAWESQIKLVEKLFTTHIKEEEEKEIPKLMKTPGVDAAKLGKDFENAAAHAVTRPHTWAPDKAPFNQIANPLTAPLDAAADAIRFKGQVPNVDEEMGKK